MGLDPTLKKEIGKVIPNGAKAGEIFFVPNRGIVQITEALSDTRVNYTYYDEPADVERLTKEAKKKAIEEAARSKAVGTVTIPNDQKLNITTGVDKLKSLQNINQIQQEKNMANELDVTEIDRIKSEKIQKEKQKEADVAAAIAIAADLKGDIQKIKEELCVGPDCLKNQVQNKLGEIDAKIAKLDEKTQFFVCERCSYDKVPSLSSFCPNCGAKIPSWTDDNGQPVAGWKPYYELHKEEV